MRLYQQRGCQFGPKGIGLDSRATWLYYSLIKRKTDLKGDSRDHQGCLLGFKGWGCNFFEPWWGGKGFKKLFRRLGNSGKNADCDQSL